MAFRLPPLSTLRVFEAAARHKSFRKAADELNLTASAVSHGIQTLENWLGVELFNRQSRGLRLTGAGEAYAPLVNQALSVLAKATDRLPGRKATGTLSLSSAPTFANKICCRVWRNSLSNVRISGSRSIPRFVRWISRLTILILRSASHRPRSRRRTGLC